MLEELTAQEQQLMNLVPGGGTSIGNKYLRTQLVWDEDTYWDVRNSLLGKGLLLTGRGKGGSVRRVVLTEVPAGPPEPVVIPQGEGEREEDLYDPAVKVLQEDWSKDKRLENFVVQKTARQGRRPTGTWSRPDLILVYVPSYQIIPQKTVEVVTFEIKDYTNFSVAAVYEALAHLRAATKSYVLVRIPAEKLAMFEAELEAAVDEAGRFGIGLIVAEKIDDYDTWDELVDAERREPDPRMLDQFLLDQVNEDNRRRLNGWL